MVHDREDTGDWRNMFVDLEKFPKVAALAIVTVWAVALVVLGFVVGGLWVIIGGAHLDPALLPWFDKILDFIGIFLVGGTVLGVGVKRGTTKASVIAAQRGIPPAATVPIQADGDVIVQPTTEAS